LLAILNDKTFASHLSGFVLHIEACEVVSGAKVLHFELLMKYSKLALMSEHPGTLVLTELTKNQSEMTCISG